MTMQHTGLDINQRIGGAQVSNGRKHNVLVDSPDGKLYVLKGATTLAAITKYLFRLQTNPGHCWDEVQETPNGWRVNPGGEHLDGFQFYQLRKQT
jgi:hypothetical protein